MSEPWVNLAIVTGTSSENFRVIAPERWIRNWAANHPYVRLYPHQVVFSGFVRVFRADADKEVPPTK